MPHFTNRTKAAIPAGVVAFEFLLIVAWACALSPRININAAMLLDCGQKIYQGQCPFADFYEFNTPVMMYLSVIPAWFSAVSGMHVCLAFQLFACMSIAVGSWLFYFACLEIGMSRLAVLRVLAIAMLFHALMLFFETFGEREHFLVIFLTPFLILRSGAFISSKPGLSRKTILFVTGFLAGVVVNIKPHFLVIPALLELRQLVLLRQFKRFQSPDMAGFFVAHLVYLASWFVMPAGVRGTYFGLMLPLALSGYDSYGGGMDGFLWLFLPNHPTLALFNDICLGLFSLTAVQTILYRPDTSSQDSSTMIRKITLGLICAWFGALACFVSQKKGWFYHMAPMNWFAMLAAAFWFLPKNENDFHLEKIPAKAIARALCPLIFIVMVLTYSQLRPRLRAVRPSFSTNLAQFIADNETGNGQVVLMASSVRAYPALLMAGRTGGSRFLDFFHLPSLYYNIKFKNMTGPEIYKVGAENTALEKQFLDELFEDIAQRRPGMILMNQQNGDTGLPPRFNICDYYHFHGIGQLLQKDYRLLGNITPGIAREPTFEVWTRKSGPEE